MRSVWQNGNENATEAYDKKKMWKKNVAILKQKYVCKPFKVEFWKGN